MADAAATYPSEALAGFDGGLLLFAHLAFLGLLLCLACCLPHGKGLGGHGCELARQPVTLGFDKLVNRDLGVVLLLLVALEGEPRRQSVPEKKSNDDAHAAR